MEKLILKRFLILGIILCSGICGTAQTKVAHTKPTKKVQAKSKISKPVVACPQGLTLINGNCVKKVIIKGKQVWVGCWGGKIVYHEIAGENTYGQEIKGPSSGQPCNGDWQKTTTL